MPNTGLNLRSRTGTPLDGAQAFREGYPITRNPYAWGYGLPYGAPFHCWAMEWQKAADDAAKKTGDQPDKP